MYVLITPKGQLYFLADATVNIEPTAEDLAEIVLIFPNLESGNIAYKLN